MNCFYENIMNCFYERLARHCGTKRDNARQGLCHYYHPELTRSGASCSVLYSGTCQSGGRVGQDPEGPWSNLPNLTFFSTVLPSRPCGNSRSGSAAAIFLE